MSDITIAAAIILYHPDDKIADYILSIRPYFETIYLFDNTESMEKTNRMRKMLHKEGIKYATKNDNMGLAYGLNVCCNAAYKDGFSWIMLFDQDSVITDSFVKNMQEFICQYDEEKLAIVAPRIDDYGVRSTGESKVRRRKEVITSGMTLKLEAFKQVGYFLNALFVDYVDYEFCLRLGKKGYFILENRKEVLHHNQYDTEKVLGGYKINKYSALRYYYIARGYRYILEHYSEDVNYIDNLKQINHRRIWRIIFYDEHKMKKLLAVLLGNIDYKRGHFGKCPWNWLM